MAETTVQAGRRLVVREPRPGFHDEDVPLTAQDLLEILLSLDEADRRWLPVRVTCGKAGVPRPLLAAGLHTFRGGARIQDMRLVVKSK